MPGVKGMGRETSHRAFYYSEKKFNSLGRDGLLHYFRTTYSPQRIQDFFLIQKEYQMTREDANRIASELEKVQWEESKGFIIPMVESILGMARAYDITNIEAFAMVCYIYEAIGKRKAVKPEEVGAVMDIALKKANRMRLENWNAFMRILKEIS